MGIKVLVKCRISSRGDAIYYGVDRKDNGQFVMQVGTRGDLLDDKQDPITQAIPLNNVPGFVRAALYRPYNAIEPHLALPNVGDCRSIPAADIASGAVVYSVGDSRGVVADFKPEDLHLLEEVYVVVHAEARNTQHALRRFLVNTVGSHQRACDGSNSLFYSQLGVLASASDGPATLLYKTRGIRTQVDGQWLVRLYSTTYGYRMVKVYDVCVRPIVKDLIDVPCRVQRPNQSELCLCLVGNDPRYSRAHRSQFVNTAGTSLELSSNDTWDVNYSEPFFDGYIRLLAPKNPITGFWEIPLSNFPTGAEFTVSVKDGVHTATREYPDERMPSDLDNKQDDFVDVYVRVTLGAWAPGAGIKSPGQVYTIESKDREPGYASLTGRALRSELFYWPGAPVTAWADGRAEMPPGMKQLYYKCAGKRRGDLWTIRARVWDGDIREITVRHEAVLGADDITATIGIPCCVFSPQDGVCAVKGVPGSDRWFDVKPDDCVDEKGEALAIPKRNPEETEAAIRRGYPSTRGYVRARAKFDVATHRWNTALKSRYRGHNVQVDVSPLDAPIFNTPSTPTEIPAMAETNNDEAYTPNVGRTGLIPCTITEASPDKKALRYRIHACDVAGRYDKPYYGLARPEMFVDKYGNPLTDTPADLKRLVGGRPYEAWMRAFCLDHVHDDGKLPIAGVLVQNFSLIDNPTPSAAYIYTMHFRSDNLPPEEKLAKIVRNSVVAERQRLARVLTEAAFSSAYTVVPALVRELATRLTGAPGAFSAGAVIKNYESQLAKSYEKACAATMRRAAIQTQSAAQECLKQGVGGFSKRDYALVMAPFGDVFTEETVASRFDDCKKLGAFMTEAAVNNPLPEPAVDEAKLAKALNQAREGAESMSRKMTCDRISGALSRAAIDVCQAGAPRWASEALSLAARFMEHNALSDLGGYRFERDIVWGNRLSTSITGSDEFRMIRNEEASVRDANIAATRKQAVVDFKRDVKRRCLNIASLAAKGIGIIAMPFAGYYAFTGDPNSFMPVLLLTLSSFAVGRASAPGDKRDSGVVDPKPESLEKVFDDRLNA